MRQEQLLAYAPAIHPCSIRGAEVPNADAVRLLNEHEMLAGKSMVLRNGDIGRLASPHNEWLVAALGGAKWRSDRAGCSRGMA